MDKDIIKKLKDQKYFIETCKDAESGDMEKI